MGSTQGSPGAMLLHLFPAHRRLDWDLVENPPDGHQQLLRREWPGWPADQSIVDTAMFVDNGEGRQGSLFIETVTLSQMFFDQPKKHPVPVEEAAVRQIPRLRPSDVCLTYHVRGMPRSV